MNSEKLEALLVKYQDGICSEEELAMIEHLLYSENEPLSVFGEENLDHHISLTKLKIDNEIEDYEFSLKRKRKSLMSSTLPYVRIAASMAIVISISVLLYIKSDIIYHFGVPEKTQIYSTTVGKQSKIQLPDGSEVWLNSTSSLSFSNRYNRQLREVTLRGEAFFKVISSHKPFIVHSGDLKTKVFGTSFNIRAYQSSRSIEVALLSGKVLVSSGVQNAVLMPNQLISLDRGNGKLGAVQNQPAVDQMAWKEGKFLFKNAPVIQVFQRLQEVYDLDFEIRDKELVPLTIYGTFKMDEQPKAIVKAICKLIDADFRFISNKRVIIYK